MKLATFGSWALGLLAVGASSALAAAVPRGLPTPPAQDPFYVPPSNLSSYKPGQIISSRVVKPPAIQDPAVGHVVQLLFRTTNTAGKESSTVTTVFAPTNPRKDPALLSLQLWEDGANSACAPSYALMAGFSGPDWPQASIENPVIAKWALAMGYYVVITDYEGPRSAFIAGYEAGQAGLDGIRAAIASYNLPKEIKVALYGYSGGGHASAWMANLQPTYAPDINVVGAAYGGTPVDVKSMIQFLDGGFSAGLVGDGLAGLLNAYPQYNSLLKNCDERVQGAINYFRTQGNCLLQAVATFNYEHFTSSCHFGNYTFYNYPAVVDIMGRETLLMNESTQHVNVPKFPRIMWHSVGDEIVPFPPAQQYVNEQCAHGANLQFAALGFGEHITGDLAGIPGALKFVREAIEGRTPRVYCGTADNFLTLDGLNVDREIGKTTADRLRALNATVTKNSLRNPQSRSAYQALHA